MTLGNSVAAVLICGLWTVLGCLMMDSFRDRSMPKNTRQLSLVVSLALFGGAAVLLWTMVGGDKG